jgi:hypothetical protein
MNFTDPSAAADAAINYYYQVRALSSAGQKSGPSNRVGEFHILSP